MLCTAEDGCATQRLWCGMDGGVEKIGILIFGGVAGFLVLDRLQTGGERFVPFSGEHGDVAEDALELLLWDVARKRDGIKASAADRRVSEHGIHVVGALGPALRE